jgi:hypothetical protein
MLGDGCQLSFLTSSSFLSQPIAVSGVIVASPEASIQADLRLSSA